MSGLIRSTPSCMLLATVVFVSAAHGDDQRPAKVFLLAGQSNMVGQALASTLQPLINDPETAGDFAHLQKDGEWTVRDDVWSIFDVRAVRGTPQPVYGPLTIGHGALKRTRDAEGRRIMAPAIGPELGFGHVVGDHFEEPVILIKAAWGGVAVKTGFLPPSAGGPGPKYTEMVDHFRHVLDNLGDYYPEYDDARGYEISGFVWFQGWNDGVGRGNPDYTVQLAHLIRDVRRDLDAPGMPVVIGELGVDGGDAGGWIATFRDQQAAVADIDEFQGNVSFVRTAPFWPQPRLVNGEWEAFRAAARENEQLSEDDPARVEPGEFYQKNWVQRYAEQLAYTSDRRYHYQGCGETYYRIGDALGQGMLELIREAGPE